MSNDLFNARSSFRTPFGAFDYYRLAKLEEDGLVSEGAATSIIYTKRGRYFTPEARSALAGVTLAVLARALARRGLELKPRPVHPSDLGEADGLWLANSLMGVMPVASVDGEAVRIYEDATKFLLYWRLPVIMLYGCASTTIRTVWMDESYHGGTLKKVFAWAYPISRG